MGNLVDPLPGLHSEPIEVFILFVRLKIRLGTLFSIHDYFALSVEHSGHNTFSEIIPASDRALLQSRLAAAETLSELFNLVVLSGSATGADVDH